MAEPSRVIAGGPEKSPVKSKPESFGGGKEERKVRVNSLPRRLNHATVASKAITAAAQIARSRVRRRGRTGKAVVTDEPLLAIHRRPRATSAAFCQRRSGSFARQSCRT